MLPRPVSLNQKAKAPALSTFIWILFFAALASLYAITWVGLNSLDTHHRKIAAQYDRWIVSYGLINQISDTLRENRNELTLLLQHYPGNLVDKVHPIQLHIDKIQDRIQQINTVWRALVAELPDSKEVQALISQLESDRTVWLQYIDKVILAAKQGELSIKMISEDAVDGLAKYRQTTYALSAINGEVIRLAKSEIEATEVAYQGARNGIVMLSLIVAALLSVLAVNTINRLKKGIASVKDFAEKTAQGDLTLPLPTNDDTRPREFQRILERIGVMRNALLDNIHTARQSAARSKATLRTMRDGIILIDSQGVIISVNDAICDTFGYVEEELIGNRVNVLMPEKEASEHDGNLSRYMRDRIPRKMHRRVELTGRKKTGELFPIEMVVNEMIDDDGSVFIGVVRDIVEQRRIQRELTDALASAQVATDAKSAFLANMSHEIRTPISAVIGFSQLALTKRHPDDVTATFRKINNAGKSLLALINDILDLSKIEAGKLELDEVEFDLDDVVKHVDLILADNARNKSIELVIGVEPGVPTQLIGDPYRLGQVLINLAGNAIKFTDRGSVTVLIDAAEVLAADGYAKLKISVIDTGIGMTPDQQARVFGAFAQADSSTTRRFGGTGLGLAITKQLVEQMGGEISIRSQPGVGSEFSFTVRFGLPTEPVIESRSDCLSGKSILVMDDNATLRALAGRILESLGCVVELADSGCMALEKVRSGMHFDAAMFDLLMPEMSGVEVARLLRDEGFKLPIILCSGCSPEMTGNQNAELFAQVLSKPISVAAVRNALISAFKAGKGRPDNSALAETHLSSIPDLRAKHILLVDDNEFNREVGAALIDMTGASFALANNGQEAVVAVDAASFDLVLMDLQMPVMDGYAAARLIKANHPDLPIIALTAHAMVEERQRILAAGMDGMLSKPIDQDKFFKVIAKWSGVTTGQSVVAPKPQAEEAPLPASAASQDPDLATQQTAPVTHFDKGLALSRVNGREELLKKFIQLFIDRNANVASKLIDLIGRNELEQAKREAHTLKGSAATIGLLAIQEIAARIEGMVAAQISAPSSHFTADFQIVADELMSAWQIGLETISQAIQ